MIMPPLEGLTTRKELAIISRSPYVIGMPSRKTGESSGDMRKSMLCKVPCSTKHKLGRGLYIDKVASHSILVSNT
jgi:hypothetical protein